MECMSFSRLFMAVLLIFIYVINTLVGLAHQASPTMNLKPPPTMHLILAVGMVIMILVSILTAYVEAMLYLKSQRTSTASSNNSRNSSQNSHHNNQGGNNKDYERSNCSPQDTCNKDRTGGSGHGAAAISTTSTTASSQSFNGLQNGPGNAGKGCNMNNNTSSNKNNPNSIGKANNNNNNCTTQKRRKNSSSTNNNNNNNNNSNNNNNTSYNLNNRVPTSCKSTSSTTSDKKSSSPYAPIFQNLTNVIASPPPPLPTFDSEFDSNEFKKLRGRKSAKKSNSLNGSIASNDDFGNSSSLHQTHVTAASSTNHVNKAKSNGKSDGLKMGATNLTNVEPVSSEGQNGDSNLKDVITSNVLSSGHEHLSRNPDNAKLYDDVAKAEYGTSQAEEQPAVIPIQPPSSLSSTPSSSSTASTSSSPPLSTSSYGEYSLLGPGATFELPCLRVRSAQHFISS